MKYIFVGIFGFLHFQLRDCCKTVQFTSVIGTKIFTQISIEKSPGKGGGRPSYETQESDVHDEQLYLYHTVAEDIRSGIGMWIIGKSLSSSESETGIAHTESWSIFPHLTTSGADKSTWIIDSVSDESVSVTCLDPSLNDAFFFESSSRLQPHLTGFYVKRYSESMDESQPVYSQLRFFEGSQPIYFFRLSEIGTWLIGEEYGIDGGSAFLRTNASTIESIQSNNWNFLPFNPSNRERSWIPDVGSIIIARSIDTDIYHSLRIHRTLQSSAATAMVPLLQLRNGLFMPSIGLGTGGLDPDHSYETISTAIALGYRLFDSAREYHNEFIFRDFLAETARDESAAKRRDLFLETKVWPTELGFIPTSQAVEYSWLEMETSYIDLYLLHWPSCDFSIDWMHCEDTVDPSATWRESWRALEKAYAEGRVMSIGVSNFNIDLLQQLERMALVLPHVVQNWAEPGSMDLAVRNWCHKNQVIYQPYASGRNLHRLNPRLGDSLKRIAANHKVSTYALTLRFFLQTGAAMIPRSNNVENLKANIQVLLGPGGGDWGLEEEEMHELGWNGLMDMGHKEL